MSKITVEAVEACTTMELFIKLVGSESGLGLADDVSLTSIDIFTLDEATVDIDGENYAFELGVTIAVDHDEDGETTQELSGTLLIDVTREGQIYKAVYGGQITIPTSDTTNLIFDIQYQTKTENNKTTKLIVGQLNIQEEQDIGNVKLAALFSQISPGLGNLVPEELLDGFNLNQNLLFVIKVPDASATPAKKKMLFGIGFNSDIAFGEIPLISNQLPPDISASQFTIELLLSLQSLDQKELKTINGFLQEIGSEIKIQPPSSSVNTLYRGASIAAYFNIGGYLRAWLVPLKRRSGGFNPNPAPPGLSLAPSGQIPLQNPIASPTSEQPIVVKSSLTATICQKLQSLLKWLKGKLGMQSGTLAQTEEFSLKPHTETWNPGSRSLAQSEAFPIISRTVTSNTGNRLAPSGEFRLVASPRTTTPEEDTPITIADNGAWLTVQKSFGTIHLEKVGLIYKTGEIHLTPQFIVQVSDFSLVLNGLSISTPLSNFSPNFNLDGFGLTYEKNSLNIAGAFLRKEREDYEEYLGMVTLGMQTKGSGGKQKSLSLSAVGAYAYVNDEPSLFLYLAVDYPLGGPPEIFVTGLAGGFGYNRDLIVPPLGEITEFPLVAQALSGVGDLSGDPGEIINEQIESLSTYIPISLDAGFLAIGIKFTTYKLLDSFALLTLALSENNFELNLIGISTLVVPPSTSSNIDPVAVVQLALQARFSLAEGLLLVQAELTPNSYILSQKCHLTGGFAAAFWFAGEHEGDFVITLGGYHPSFKVPTHYPTVPRLGFNWQLDSHTSITGEGYFALCSHAVMAGGALKFSYKSGKVHASFEVGADFLICWKPYYYDISARIKISGGIGCISVSVRVELHLWGPELGGKAKIDLWIASATVKFGDQGSRDPLPIAWDEFKSSFLPEATEICSIAASKGLVKQLMRGEEEIWIINPTTLELVTDSFIPAKKAFTWDDEQSISTNTGFAINPMGINSDDLETTHKVTISKGGNSEDAKGKFSFAPVTKAAPTGIWGNPNLTDKGRLKLPEVNGQQFENGVFSGFRIIPAESPKAGESNTIGVEHLQNETSLIDNSYSWQTLEEFVANPSYTEEPQKRDRIRETITTNSQRDALLQALGFDPSQVQIDSAIADSFVFAPQVK
ncbi:DUF6603 domain-containing protein [Aerosakkonema sp. BLCC-F183]|uniref:DUF6603 domain-containing protein n=1 Tax=Aerosakkonema sp. BLCC-F183 TaxID=3342834 RepID=UPI0035B7E776